MYLNELLPEFDYDFLAASNGSPSYCSQVPFGAASLQGGERNDVDDPQIADSTTQNADGYSFHNQEAIVVPGEVEVDVTEDVVEDVWLTPPVPYAWKTFCSKQEAREFYNSYTERIGFSRTSTARLSGLTRERNKLQFVYNKKMLNLKKNAESDDNNFDEDSDPEAERRRSWTVARREKGKRCCI